jgi:hypothetical protein
MLRANTDERPKKCNILLQSQVVRYVLSQGEGDVFILIAYVQNLTFSVLNYEASMSFAAHVAFKV